MLNLFNFRKTKNGKARKVISAAVALLLAGVVVAGYYMLPAAGAVVDVLSGNGNMDNSTQVGAWTLTNVTGASSWSLDTGTYFAAPGSGRLRSPAGNGISYNSYVAYRFTTGKVPVSATLNVAYRKQYSNGQPSAGNWTVQAEIWQVGGGAPLQTIPINNGNGNVSWTNLTNLNVSAITQMNTQYELRLVQKGRTGNSSSAYVTTWFDAVTLNVDYDSSPPQVVSASAPTDHNVDVVFNETVDRTSAQTISNYSISPDLAVTGATLQADGKTVRLITATQTRGTDYTVTVNNVSDVSGNAMISPGTAAFTGVDTTPPTVVSAVADNDITISVLFNEPVDSWSAQNTANYSIAPSLAVTGAVLQADGKTVQLTTARQTWQTAYTVTVSNVTDTSSNVIAGNNTAVFTGADNTAPEAVSAAAVNDTTVDVVFSEKVDASSAQAITNYVIDPGLAVNNAVLQADGKTVRLTTARQTYLANYTVTVTGVKDLAGNVIGGNRTTAFSGADSTPPAVVSAAGISYNTVNVVFSEKVDKTTAETAVNYVITPDLAVDSAVLQADGVTVQLVTAAQKGGTAYTVNVSGVQDLAGNVIGAAGNSAAFVGTSPPVSAPLRIVSAEAPDNNTVKVVFSATLDPITAQNPANYAVSPVLAVSGASLEKDGVTVRLATATQTAGTVYTVTVANVQDIYGNTVGSTDNSVAFTGSRLSGTDPHGNYLNDTDQCAKCHVTHNAQGPGLINRPAQAQTCYLCHDAGGQSRYDVAAQFGATAQYAVSHHKVPEGSQQCSDCHNPHDGGKDAQGTGIHWTRLLQSSASPTTHGGNEFCLSCHRTAQGDTGAVDPATYPAEGIGHNDASFAINGVTPFNPSSGTGISCLACHEQHGSALPKLLKTDPNHDTTAVTGDDQTLCYECHAGASADGRYLGRAAYDNTTYNPHALTASTRTNASYPGVTGRAGQCANCHDPHGSAYGTAQVSMKTLRGVYNDGKTSYNAADFTFCFNCHNSTSADSRYDIQTPYNDARGGHYIKTAGGNLAVGSKLPCEACHSLHGSANNNRHLLQDSLGSNLGDGRSECLACHRAGKVVEGITMSAPPSAVPEHTGTDTACLSCHGSAHAPNDGVSAGGQNCGSCHSTLATALSSAASGYHHLLNNTDSTYSTTPNGAKNCLSCHVDHNKFNNQKAFNLKANFTQSFPANDQTPGRNTDYDADDTVYGGLCLSCHQNPQTKSYAQADGTTTTPPISVSGYAESAHNYTAASTFGDGTSFNANCTKCHNDDMTKNRQTSADKFGAHDSGYRRILSPFGDSSLTDPLKEQFCLKCHNTGGDVYGTAMSAAAKGVQSDFARVSRHDLTGATGAQLTCVNCHGPHNVSRNAYSAGLSSSDIADPANTLLPFTTASGSISDFCLRCHGGTPPGYVNNGTVFVPYSVTFPAWNFTANGSGWNKSSYSGSGHSSQGYRCNTCHDHHGSPYARLTLFPEDPATAPASDSGVCLRCHGNQAGRPPGAADVYTDLTRGTDFTYRHPTLDTSGKHLDTETFPWTTANRHAECADCHDPHAANAAAGADGNASGKIANVSGVTPVYPAPNSVFAQAVSFTAGTAAKEYQLCFKCHTGYNGNFPTPPAGTMAETDLAREFNPANPSFHDVGLYTGTARSYVGSFRTSTNMNGSTVLYCTSCHGADSGTTTLTATSGPVHGSANRYILRGPWNSSLTLGSSTASNNLCLKCHNVTSGSSRFADGTRNLHSLGDHSSVACQSCHAEVPHGGIRPSLVTVMPSSPYTGIYKYDANYDGVYGKNSKLYLKAWKSGGTRWNKSDCGCNGTGH